VLTHHAQEPHAAAAKAKSRPWSFRKLSSEQQRDVDCCRVIALSNASAADDGSAATNAMHFVFFITTLTDAEPTLNAALRDVALRAQNLPLTAGPLVSCVVATFY
jgi:hypothetical protein